MNAIARRQLADHRLQRPPREATAPIAARELIGDPGAAVLVHRCLHIARKLAVRKANHPVQPVLAAIGGAARFEASKPLAQPCERGWRLPFMLVDRWVAQHGEHLLGMRGPLRLEREALSRERSQAVARVMRAKPLLAAARTARIRGAAPGARG